MLGHVFVGFVDHSVIRVLVRSDTDVGKVKRSGVQSVFQFISKGQSQGSVQDN